jgi:spoIIIJ-associated protein
MKMESIEVTGKTLDEAIKNALAQLKVKRKDVKIEVLSEEEKGLFGLDGAKPARIRVTVIKKTNT